MFVTVEIAFFGHSAFRLKGKNKTVVIDPYGDQVGKLPRDLEADIVAVTHEHFDHNAVDRVKGEPFVIRGPGEYEVGGVSVVGVAVFHDEQEGAQRGVNTVYVIEIDGLRVVHLGDLGHKLSEQALEEIGSVDVALVPVGGVYTIDAKTAKEVISQLDPWVAVPMHYRMEELAMKDLGTLEEFLKEMGKPDILSSPKLVLSADSLPAEFNLVVLEKK